MGSDMQLRPGLVSVVVPIFNLDPSLLERCLDSIAKQTYQSIEILVVDDGSRSDLLNGYEEVVRRHSMARLFTIEHSGVSAARNEGMRQAKGEYLSFVDADDFVKPNMVETLVESMRAFNADVSCAISEIHQLSGRTTYDSSRAESALCWSREESLVAFFSGRLSESACGKLFKTANVASIEFPVGRSVCEDASFVFNALMGSDLVVLSATPLYCYVRREGSATKSGFSEKEFGAIDSGEEMVAEVSIREPGLVPFASAYLLGKHLCCLRTMRRDETYMKRNRASYLTLRTKIRDFRSEREALSLTSKQQIELFFAVLPAWMYGLFVNLFDFLRR